MQDFAVWDEVNTLCSPISQKNLYPVISQFLEQARAKWSEQGDESYSESHAEERDDLQVLQVIARSCPFL